MSIGHVSIWLMVLLALAGCTDHTTALRLDPVVTQAPPTAIPSIQPLVLNPIHWRVFNRADLEALVAKMKAQNDTTSVIFAVDATGLENMRLNYVELQRYLSEQKAVIVMLIKVVNQNAGVLDLPVAIPPAGVAAPP